MKHGESMNIDGAGEVSFERSPRARRLSVTVKPSGLVRVAVPHGASLEEAHSFVSSKASWVSRQLASYRLKAERSALVSAAFKPSEPGRADTMLAGRLKALSRKHGFASPEFTIREQKTLWGSCSAANRISLNRGLAALPGELRDYVICHELLHTLIKNHGKRFRKELDRMVGDSRALESRLRGFHPELL